MLNIELVQRVKLCLVENISCMLSNKALRKDIVPENVLNIDKLN